MTSKDGLSLVGGIDQLLPVYLLCLPFGLSEDDEQPTQHTAVTANSASMQCCLLKARLLMAGGCTTKFSYLSLLQGHLSGDHCSPFFLLPCTRGRSRYGSSFYMKKLEKQKG